MFILEIALILAREIAVMFLLIGVGILCKRFGVLDEKAARQISNFLLLFVTPALLLRSFQHQKQPELLKSFWVVLGASVFIHVLGIVVANLCIRKKAGDSSVEVARLGVVFSNCGYMGTPLLLATIGEAGRLYVAAYLGAFTVFLWTWGAFRLGGKERVSLRKALLNPGVLGFAAGLALFLAGFLLPDILLSVVDNLYLVNMPLSMVAVGVFLAGIRIRETLADLRIWKVVALRNVAVPLAVVALFYLSGAAGRMADGHTVMLAIVVAAATPSAVACVLFPARFGADSAFGAKLVALSTLLSLATLPLVAYVALSIL